MPSTWTTFINFLSLMLTFAAKSLQILLFSENIKYNIPNKVTRYSYGWRRTSKGVEEPILANLSATSFP